MAEVTLDDVSKKAGELFQKAASAMERNNLSFAMDLLISILDVEPRFLQARKLLRAAQAKRYMAAGGGNHLSATLSGIGGLISASMQIKSKPLQAVKTAETLLSKDPYNKTFVSVFVKAALAADLPEAAIHTLEVLRDSSPDDVDILFQLGALYKKHDITDKARAVYERLIAIRPNDPKAIKALKDAQAMDTMQAGRWNEAAGEVGGYRKVMKDADEAQRLEQASKAMKSADDIDSLIEEQNRKIEREPNNMNFRRALSDLYGRAGRLDEALAALQAADQISGGGDPQIDRAISNLKIKQFDARLATLREAGDADGLAEEEARKKSFLLDDATERVKRYPNDLQFKYEWGVLLLEDGKVDEAIQQFQQSQRNPQRRIRSLYYLALCFKTKNQFDIAAEQLEKAASELTILDGTKKDILYELGATYEDMGQPAKAAELFKQIYSVDISYKDIAARIEKSYQRPKE